ncbi:MAG TPA: transcription factor S [Candidatus Aenigmarchaeota archaeon]|nr:transcription factor S [Candidatus Aenigmarchaeota archaeon]
MEFCECGGMLIPSGSSSVCRNCGKKTNKKVDVRITTKKEQENIVVIEDNKPDLPKTNKECKKCKNNVAYYWLIQTRSADEPPTQFFKCTKCKHTWREYK